MGNGSLHTNLGKNIVIGLAYGVGSYSVPSKFKVGILNDTPLVTDTDLDVPVPITGTEAVDDCGTADWADSADMTTALNSTTFKEGTKSLNLTKDAATSATVSCDKTTTSRDFTSKTLFVWLYIKNATAYAKLATTDCLTLRFGSDNANYYIYTRDKADLAVGWNLIYFTSATADGDQGTPTIAACDYSYLALKATAAAITWSAGDFIMDDWKLASADDFTKTFMTSYPTLDTTNHEIELRCQLLTTEANGHDLNGFALFNTDAPDLMSEEDTHTAESKSDTDEFIYIVRNRIE